MIKNQKMIGNLLLTLTALIWGTAFVFQRKGMESIEPITFTSARMALAAVAVGNAAFIFTKKPVAKTAPSESKKISAESKKISAETERKNRRKNTVLGGICCGAFLACASIFQQMGIVYTTAGKAGFITAMYMIIVPVIGFVLFKKRNTWIVWLAVLIGVAGMYLLCITEGFTLTRGDTLVCICAVLFSGHILCCDYFVQRGEPIWISAIQFVTCWRADLDFCHSVCHVFRAFCCCRLYPGDPDLGKGRLGCHSDSLLRDTLRRRRIYTADHSAEVYRSDHRIPSDEPGVRICGAGRSNPIARTHDTARNGGLRSYVHCHSPCSDSSAGPLRQRISLMSRMPNSIYRIVL